MKRIVLFIVVGLLVLGACAEDLSKGYVVQEGCPIWRTPEAHERFMALPKCGAHLLPHVECRMPGNCLRSSGEKEAEEAGDGVRFIPSDLFP